MAIPGQRFELDLDAPNFTANVVQDDGERPFDPCFVVKEIQEHEPAGIPAAPKKKLTKSGFPEHKTRGRISAFKQRQQAGAASSPTPAISAHNATELPFSTQVPPSDRAIAHHVSKKYGYDPNAQVKADIEEENKRRIAEMSDRDIEEARAELMQSLDPAFIERLLRKANIDDEAHGTSIPENGTAHPDQQRGLDNAHQQSVLEQMDTEQMDSRAISAESPAGPAVHFPAPPRPANDFVPLDPNAPTFLADLRTHYFPDTPHDPSTLSWLQDPTMEENEDSPYNPTKTAYTPSSLRFGFSGRLIAPADSLDIDVSKGLHHHGEAPSSAGYTIPELAILARSALPNQRCIAYQLLGRILYRLGRGDFGPRGMELPEGLWTIIEKERVVELIMNEASKEGDHVSAKSYATEALWLWRRGGGGERGLLRSGEKRVA